MIAYLKKQFMDFMKEEDGVGVIEVVLILVVLIGLVIIFKDRINALLELTFKQIDNQSKEVY
jgi:Flp pilus assembly pilin Flp